MDVAFIPPAPAPAPSEPHAAVAETDDFALHLDAAEDTDTPPEDPAPRTDLTTGERPRPQPASLAIDAAILFTHAAPRLATDVAPAITTPAPLLEPSIEGDAQAPAIPPVEPKSAPHIALPVAAPATTANAPPPAKPSAAPHAPADPRIATPPAIAAAHEAEPAAIGAAAAAPDAQPTPLNAAPIASAAQPARPAPRPQASQTTPPASPTTASDEEITPAPPSPEALAPAIQPARTAQVTQATPAAATPAPEQQQPAARNANEVEAPEPAQPPAALASAQRATAPRAEIGAAQPAHNNAVTAAAPSADPVPIDSIAALAVASDGDIAPSETHTARAAQAATPAAQIAQHIVRRIDNGATRFDLRLDPPELGRVEVRLELGRDHRVTALIAAEEPATLAQLTRAAREIELTLESAGLELAENGLSFDLSGGGEAERDAQTFSAGAHAAPARGQADADPPPARRALALESWRGARVDLVA